MTLKNFQFGFIDCEHSMSDAEAFVDKLKDDLAELERVCFRSGSKI